MDSAKIVRRFANDLESHRLPASALLSGDVSGGGFAEHGVDARLGRRSELVAQRPDNRYCVALRPRMFRLRELVPDAGVLVYVVASRGVGRIRFGARI